MQTSWCAKDSNLTRITMCLHARFLTHQGSNFRACATPRSRERWTPWKLLKSLTDILAHGQAESDQSVPSSADAHVPKIFVIFNQPPMAVSCSSLKRTREPLKNIYQTTNEINIFSLLNIFKCYLCSDAIRWWNIAGEPKFNGWN